MIRTLAWIAFVVALTTSALAAVVLPANAFVVVLVVPFAIVGLVLVLRRPEHRVGRLFCSFAATFGLAVLANAYATAGLAARSVAPGAAEVAWVYSWNLGSLRPAARARAPLVPDRAACRPAVALVRWSDLRRRLAARDGTGAASRQASARGRRPRVAPGCPGS